ncbi:hypothetical protein [Halorarius litoreus]|uniref:DUF5789 family protein n=1 Tax=Halorarius litoreus TaxID=2962676 RepID=UPI0020CBEF1A|nr:hypothetical protein [Halorarius litoreus]
MSRTVKLSRLPTFLETLDYPLSRRRIAGEVDDVTLLMADGEAPLDTVVDRLSSNRFESSSELEAELYQFLPIEAVGEPGQAEGDA